MTTQTNRENQPDINQKVVVIVGGLGSGKSEVAVNLATKFARKRSETVAIADLDIHNPYFRSREAVAELESLGVKSLIPPGSQAFADLPIIIPEIQGAIRRTKGRLILDVGGDDTGARVLSSLSDAFTPGGYDLLLVLNSNRPFTSDLVQSLKMLAEIESSSRLKFTGIISNAHLMDDTTSETVLTGLKLSEEVSAASGLPIVCVAAETEIARKLETSSINYPLLSLNRSLLKPWEKKV